MVLNAEASLMSILFILQLPVKSDIAFLQYSLVVFTLLKSHQVRKSVFETKNEPEMSYDISRVNWAIATFLVSYSLLMTKEKQKETRTAYVSIPQTIMTIT